MRAAQDAKLLNATALPHKAPGVAIVGMAGEVELSGRLRGGTTGELPSVMEANKKTEQVEQDDDGNGDVEMPDQARLRSYDTGRRTHTSLSMFHFNPMLTETGLEAAVDEDGDNITVAVAIDRVSPDTVAIGHLT